MTNTHTAALARPATEVVRPGLLALGVIATAANGVRDVIVQPTNRYEAKWVAMVVLVLVAVPALLWWAQPLYRVVLVPWAGFVVLVALASFGTFTIPLTMVGYACGAAFVPPGRVDLRSTGVVAGALAVAVAGFAVAWYLCPPGSRAEDVGTAGNRAVYFFGDLQQAHHDDEVAAGLHRSTMGGGADDPWGSAYDQLCSRLQDDVSLERFRTTGGAAVSEALTATGYSGSRHGDRYIVGVDVERAGIETLDQAVTITWLNADLRWNERDGAAFTGRYIEQTWRIDLVREGRTWRVCGFTRVR